MRCFGSEKVQLVGLKHDSVKNAASLPRRRSVCYRSTRRPKLLALVSLLTLAPLVPLRAQYIYETNNNAITITRYTGTGGTVTIPNFINNLPVTTIGNSAFTNCYSLTQVTVPGNVSLIDYQAFAFCTNLASVTLSSGLVTIGSYAFGVCFKLTHITLPNSVTNVGSFAFSACINLTDFTFPSSVTNIGFSALDGCPSMTAIAVDPLNPAYTSASGVLFDKTQSTLIEYPTGRAGDYTIPTTVTTIYPWAFSSCYYLTEITIPPGVASIGDSAFLGTMDLTNILVDPLNSNFCSVAGILFDKNQTTLIYYPMANAGSYAIPNTVTTISPFAFAECSGLTSVTIPNSVTNIGQDAFEDCDGLTSISLPNSVTSIGDTAFSGCESLTSAVIGQGVIDLGMNTFANCYSLSQVYFLGNAPSTDSPVFLGDTNTVYYMPNTTGWTSTFAYRPTALWNPQPFNLSFQNHQFSFYFTGPTNTLLIVEACTDLSNPVWTPLTTNVLVNGSVGYFSDSQSTNFPARFYRLRAP